MSKIELKYKKPSLDNFTESLGDCVFFIRTVVCKLQDIPESLHQNKNKQKKRRLEKRRVKKILSKSSL